MGEVCKHVPVETDHMELNVPHSGVPCNCTQSKLRALNLGPVAGDVQNLQPCNRGTVFRLVHDHTAPNSTVPGPATAYRLLRAQILATSWRFKVCMRRCCL